MFLPQWARRMVFKKEEAEGYRPQGREALEVLAEETENDWESAGAMRWRPPAEGEPGQGAGLVC